MASIEVALIGRNSRCKTLFLKAASRQGFVSATASETEATWTSNLAPKQGELDQVPQHGFSPSGERLLWARLSHLSAAEIFGEETGHIGDGNGENCWQPIVLVVPADVAFQKGKPRISRDGINPVMAAVIRLRERFGGRRVQFAVALSVDCEDEGGLGLAAIASAKAFIRSVQEELEAEGVPVVAVTPRTELWLREQEEEGGRVSYRRGDSQFRVHPAFAQLMDKRDIARARAAFEICGGTGVIAAVSAAVNLHPPTLVFPVGDFSTMQSSGWCRDGAPPAALRTCRLMRASSTARDLFAVEKKEGIFGGEIQSAEICAAPANSTARAEPLPLELDAPIGKGVWIIRLVGSRKAAQVWKVGATAATVGKGGKPLASVQFGDLRSKDRRRGRS